MISNVSSAAGVPAPAPDSSQAASGKTLVQTPIGSVMEDEQTTPDFYALFSPMTQSPAATPSSAGAPATPDAAAATPSVASVFGAQPWMADPGGTGPHGAEWNYNPIYFATPATAQKVASMVGGTVVAKDDIISAGGPFQQTQPNELVQLANGTTVNAGLIANFFNHGYPQSYIDALLQNVTNGEQT